MSPPPAAVNKHVMSALSPNEMKPFAGAFSAGIPRLVRRFLGKALFVIPPLASGYYLRVYLKSENIRLFRKEGIAETLEREKLAAEAAKK